MGSPQRWTDEQTTQILAVLDRMITEGEWAREVRDLLTGEKRKAALDEPAKSKDTSTGQIEQHPVQEQYQHNLEQYTKQIQS